MYSKHKCIETQNVFKHKTIYSRDDGHICLPFWLKQFYVLKLFSPPARPWVLRARGFTSVGYCCMWGWRLDAHLRPSVPCTVGWYRDFDQPMNTQLHKTKKTQTLLIWFWIFHSKLVGGWSCLTPSTAKLLKGTSVLVG